MDKCKKAAAYRDKKESPLEQKETSQSLREMTEKLTRLSDGLNGGLLASELRDAIYILKTQRLRSTGNAHTFRAMGGLAALLQLVHRCRECRGRDMVLLLGALGNLCALERETRSIVVKDALPDLISILKNATTSAVLNTTSRVIANLALDTENIALIQEHGIMRELSQALFSQVTDSGCKQSMLRAVRILSDDSECREELKENEGLLAICECLKSEDDAIGSAALQTTEVLLTQESDPDIVQALCSHQAVPSIVKFCSHPKTKIRKEAVNVLLQCARNSDGRVAMGSAGGVETLVKHLKMCDPAVPIYGEVTCALCACCRDVISRQRLRDCGGLVRLIEILSKPELAPLHGDVLSALICYYFDENTLKFMVKGLSLLKALTYQLQEMTKRPVQPTAVDTGASSKLQREEDTDLNSETQLPTPDVELASQGSETNQGSEDCNLTEAASLESSDSSTPESTHKFNDTSCDVNEMEIEGDSQQDNQPITTSATTEAFATMSANDSFSTPPPSKKPRLQLDFDSSTPMPANFIDSLLSSPNPYQTQYKLGAPFSTERGTTVETQVILLLSRVSHLRDCLTNLATAEVLLTIIDYYFSCEYPNVHIFKILTRIFMNPHCFQDCLISLIPSMIYKHLSLPVDVSSEPTTSHMLSPCLNSSSNSQKNSTLHCYSPLHFSPIVTPDSIPTRASPFMNSWHLFYSMCWELLERLSKVAESPYGQGVLAHMVLRGEDKEKQASCLAMPLLCRSVRICHKMMLGYKGLGILSGLTTNEESDLQMLAIDSFLALARNLDKLGQKRKHSLSDEGSSYLQPIKLPPVDSRESSVSDDLSISTQGCLRRRSSSCKYRDSDHCPFDLILCLGSALKLPVHKSVMTESSDVFSVMLGGQYRESLHNEVHIKDVSPNAFKSLVHHLYGCGWLCPTVLEEVMHAELEQNTEYQLQEQCNPAENEATGPSNSSFKTQTLATVATESMIDEIVSIYDFLEDKQLVKHSLQMLACAGRFLLQDLCAQCENFAKSYVTPMNVVPAFHFAQLHQSWYLAQGCLKTIVAMPHSHLKREVFKDLVLSTEGKEALRMFESFIIARLN